MLAAARGPALSHVCHEDEPEVAASKSNNVCRTASSLDLPANGQIGRPESCRQRAVAECSEKRPDTDAGGPG